MFWGFVGCNKMIYYKIWFVKLFGSQNFVVRFFENTEFVISKIRYYGFRFGSNFQKKIYFSKILFCVFWNFSKITVILVLNLVLIFKFWCIYRISFFVFLNLYRFRYQIIFGIAPKRSNHILADGMKVYQNFCRHIILDICSL